MVISHRLIILGRHFALKQYGSLGLPGSLRENLHPESVYPGEVFSVSYPIRQTDHPAPEPNLMTRLEKCRVDPRQSCCRLRG